MILKFGGTLHFSYGSFIKEKKKYCKLPLKLLVIYLSLHLLDYFHGGFYVLIPQNCYILEFS